MAAKVKRPGGKQGRFADLYLANGMNATQAYKDAGYTAKNENVAAVGGSRLLRRGKVRAYLDAQMAALAMGVGEALALLADTARDPEEKTSDRNKALELILRGHGAFIEKLEVTEKLLKVDI